MCLGQLRGLPWAAAEFAQDVPGFGWALARSPEIAAGRAQARVPSPATSLKVP
jgi:hypothetical protein